jgi:hypothetical protein
MTEELDVLKIIGERLDTAGISFMLTGSFALGYYAKPRMTRDLDFVVALMECGVRRRVDLDHKPGRFDPLEARQGAGHRL